MPGPISPSNHLTSSPNVQAAKGVLPSLKTGSIIVAQVIRTEAQTPQQIKQGLQRIQLRMEGQLISVNSNKPMQAGATVKLQVTGPNQWAMLPTTAASKTLPTDLNAWMQAQRHSLPTQTELGSAIRNLLTQSANLTNLSQNSSLNPLAKILLASNRELLSTMLSRSDLSDPAKILRAIKNSGVAFESKILGKNELSAGKPNPTGNPGLTATARTANPTSGDIKSILLKTIQRLEGVKAVQTKQGSASGTSATTTLGKQAQTPPPNTTSQPSNTNVSKTSAERSSNPQTTAPNPNPAVPRTLTAQTPTSPTANPKSAQASVITQTNPANTKTPLSVPNTLNSGAKPEIPINPNSPSRGSAEIVELVLKQLSGGLAKIQLQQLQSVGSQNQWNNPANVQNSWVLDLPVLNNPNVDSFNIRIDQEDPRTDSENGRVENGWVVTLRFDLDRLGPIAVKARLVGLEVSMDLWSQRPSVLKLMQKEFANLQQALELKGLEVKSLKSHYGELKEPRPVLEQSLLHVET